MAINIDNATAAYYRGMQNASSQSRWDYNQAMSPGYSPSQDVYVHQISPERASEAEIRAMISRCQTEIDYRERQSCMMGPTPNELTLHESLRNAWSEYLVVRKLIGLK